MQNNPKPGPINEAISLGENEYKRLSTFIMSHFGIKLPPEKKTLLQCRLQKRLKSLKLYNFREYVEYVFTPEGRQNEISQMIDAVTTNKTDFFREPSHFDFLLENGLFGYLEKTGKKSLSVWSAGCSSGEEPYTLAMIFKEFALQYPSFDFNITATDISDSVLQLARVGIYNEEKTNVIPLNYKKKYFLKGKNGYANKVRIIPELQSKIDFRKFNLLESDYATLGKFDIIFCRNVLIYFERQVQNHVLNQFSRSLSDNGLLFLGHSESMAGHELPFRLLVPTIFQKNIPFTHSKKPLKY
jgi:chemotaxis protein methyltransferase CheR